MSNGRDRRMGGFLRDRENGWLFGVCAGLADRAALPVPLVRTLAVFALLIWFWPAAIVYLGAALVLSEKPLTWSGGVREQDFWRRCDRNDTRSRS